jgi:hypothetical protein
MIHSSETSFYFLNGVSYVYQSAFWHESINGVINGDDNRFLWALYVLLSVFPAGLYFQYSALVVLGH